MDYMNRVSVVHVHSIDQDEDGRAHLDDAVAALNGTGAAYQISLERKGHGDGKERESEGGESNEAAKGHCE